jgi:hypothetical protein
MSASSVGYIFWRSPLATSEMGDEELSGKRNYRMASSGRKEKRISANKQLKDRLKRSSAVWTQGL